MTDKNALDLLVDLAKLLRKYGPNTFEKLAAHIGTPEFTARLSDILTASSRTSRSVRTCKRHAKPTKPGASFRASLIDLEGMVPEKSSLLLQLYDGLLAKTLLPTLREMNGFLSDNGLAPLKATSRQKAIIPFVKFFLPLPLSQIKSYLARLHPTDTADDRSLDGWSSVIFGRKDASR